MMKVAVFGRSATEENCQALNKLCELLQNYDVAALVYEPFLTEVLASGNKIYCSYDTFSDFDAIKDQISYLLSIGGDGTLLNTVDFVKDSGIPVVGINTGRLGFLANYTVDTMDQMVQNIKDKNYESDHRSLLKIESNKDIFGSHNFALNEFTIQKKDPSAVVKIHAYLNQEFLSSYWCDGIIVSTPTGSTGYSMSANGPIMLPNSHAMVITPIAPHNLNHRPIVIPDDSEVELKIGDSRGPCFCTIDSKYWEIDNEFEFFIKKADFTLNIIRPPKTDFIDTLRNKLMWGIDNRNK